MEEIFGLKMDRETLLQHVSSMSQIARARLFKYEAGKADGIKAVDVKLGLLNFTVLLDRGMDIGNMDYGALPVAWISKMGIHSPVYFENQGEQFLRSFGGGLLTTCGLSQVGAPCQEDGEYLGLHGRISHSPAEKHRIDEYWENDEYFIKISGQAREAMLYSENLVLKREIICKYGESAIYINDIIENEGYQESPFMLMYHMNFCFPLVSEFSKIYSTATEVAPWVSKQQPGGGDFQNMTQPIPGYSYECFMHKMPLNQKIACVAIINENIGFGVYLEYSPEQLPCFNQWKMTGQQDYVVAFEPGNTLPIGRAEARRKGTLSMIQPQEQYRVDMKLGILGSKDEIRTYLNRMNH